MRRVSAGKSSDSFPSSSPESEPGSCASKTRSTSVRVPIACKKQQLEDEQAGCPHGGRATKNGSICFPSNICTWKSRNAMRKMARAHGNRLAPFPLFIPKGGPCVTFMASSHRFAEGVSRVAPIKIQCRRNYSEKSFGAGASVFKALHTISACSGASQVKGKKQRKRESDRCRQTSHEKARVGNHTLSRPTITCKESATWGLATTQSAFSGPNDSGGSPLSSSKSKKGGGPEAPSLGCASKQP